MKPEKTKLLLSFLFVSLYSVGFETFLTRYFAVTNWAEYGYWIISIVMAGFAISGVLLSMFKGFFSKHSGTLLAVIPMLLAATSAAGMYLVSINQFNPLEVQHEMMWANQLGNILLYYLALLPAFILLGLFIGLVYVINYSDISRIYAVNLVGSAFGSVSILALMYCADLFSIMAFVLPLLLVPIVLSPLVKRGKSSAALIAAGIAIFALSELYFVKNNARVFPFYKMINTTMNTGDNRLIKTMSLPDGYYMIMESMLEFNNLDLSNNYENLGMGEPPRSLGVYKDGSRVSSLMQTLPTDYSYLNGALDALPYRLRSDPAVLLAGTNGGFRIAERRALGVKRLTALESDPTLFSLVKDVVVEHRLAADGYSFVNDSPYTYLPKHKELFDIIDISAEFLTSNGNNKYSFTSDAVRQYLAHLEKGGVLSISVNITEFPVYFTKLLETVRSGLDKSGPADPTQYIIVYRSNWTARILVSNEPFSSSDISTAVQFCNDCSFNASYYPGIDPSNVTIWNTLPPVSFTDMTSGDAGGEVDAVMDDAITVLGAANADFLKGNFFNLQPSSADRPSFFSVLRLSNLKNVLARRSVLPQEEIGFLVNIFIIVQAVVLALLVLLLPLIRIRPGAKATLRIPGIMLYFAALGLGFLFIEMALIERFSLFIGNPTASFAFVLTVMLIFSGLGSFISSRFTAKPLTGMGIGVAVIAASVVLYSLFLFPLVLSAGGAPFAVKALVMVLVIAPVSVGLGMPFPLGISALSENSEAMVPWAWAINGAFSIIATPLANIVTVSSGFNILFIVSIILYLSAWAVFHLFAARGGSGEKSAA